MVIPPVKDYEKVVDFGLAEQPKLVEGETQEETLMRLSENDASAGTLGYMSPQLLWGSQSIRDNTHLPLERPM